MDRESQLWGTARENGWRHEPEWWGRGDSSLGHKAGHGRWGWSSREGFSLTGCYNSSQVVASVTVSAACPSITSSYKAGLYSASLSLSLTLAVSSQAEDLTSLSPFFPICELDLLLTTYGAYAIEHCIVDFLPPLLSTRPYET